MGWTLEGGVVNDETPRVLHSENAGKNLESEGELE
jgi:hypothetical protein